MKTLRLILFALLLVGLAPAATVKTDLNRERLDTLFERLKDTVFPFEAAAIEGLIWNIWTHRGVTVIDQNMTLGILTMNEEKLKSSLSHFDKVVRLDPNFAEGWNKRATVYYMMGDFDASVADIQKTLTLEPRHFGALSGLGLIYDAIDKPAAAVKVWQKALEINPHMQSIRHRIEEIQAEEKGKGI